MTRPHENPEREMFEEYVISCVTDESNAFPVSREQALSVMQFMFKALYLELRSKGEGWLTKKLEDLAVVLKWPSNSKKRNVFLHGGSRRRKNLT